MNIKSDNIHIQQETKNVRYARVAETSSGVDSIESWSTESGNARDQASIISLLNDG